MPNSAFLNQLVQAELAPAPVAETYTVEPPSSATGQAIFQKIVEASRENGLHTDTVLRIASCESNLRQHRQSGAVLRGRHNANDVGIFQINEEYHLAQSHKLGFDLNQTDDNIAYAMWLMKKEGNRHWNWSKPCWNSERILKN